MADEPAAPRHQLHGYVSKEARDGWYEFSGKHGTNVTALLEAVGELLGTERSKDPGKLPTWLRQVVNRSRVIASSRSSRRRPVN